MKNFWSFITVFSITASFCDQLFSQSDTLHLHQAYTNSEKAE